MLYANHVLQQGNLSLCANISLLIVIRCFSVEDDTRPGKTKISVTKVNIAAVKIVVEQDARLSVKAIATCSGISEGISEKAFGPEKGLR